MSMTVTEANAANVVAEYVLAVPARRGVGVAELPMPPDDGEVADALKVLLRGAYRRLAAGMTPESVNQYPMRQIP